MNDLLYENMSSRFTVPQFENTNVFFLHLFLFPYPEDNSSLARTRNEIKGFACIMKVLIEDMVVEIHQ